MVLSFIAGGRTASAQTYTADARKVAMGGVGADANIASSMVESVEPYTVIPLPFGLIQVLKNYDQFNRTATSSIPSARSKERPAPFISPPGAVRPALNSLNKGLSRIS